MRLLKVSKHSCVKDFISTGCHLNSRAQKQVNMALDVNNNFVPLEAKRMTLPQARFRNRFWGWGIFGGGVGGYMKFAIIY